MSRFALDRYEFMAPAELRRRKRLLVDLARVTAVYSMRRGQTRLSVAAAREIIHSLDVEVGLVDAFMAAAPS